MRNSIPFVLAVTMLLALATGCGKKYTPKPRGHFRIDFPVKGYQLFDANFPYSFEFPVYAKIEPDTLDKEPYWIDISIPANKAKFHLSYKKVENNLDQLTEDSRELAYKHSIKASSIEEDIYENPVRKVYGTVYNIKGNAASPMQFYLTDSVEHFLRGSMYISEIPNYDSLQPVINFLEADMIRLIETLSWK